MRVDSISLSKYEEENYEVKESKSGWVDYGEDNLFPQYLINLFYSSPVHSALVTSIASLIFGQGVHANGRAKLQFLKWGIEDDLQKLCVDLKLQGGFVLEVHYDADKKPKNLYHVPFEKVRSGIADAFGDVHQYYYCNDWEDTRKNKPIPVEAWNPRSITGEKQYLYVKPFAVGSSYYPKPDYMGAINWIEIDKRIAIFHNNNIMNGMTPSLAIAFKNGIPDPQQRMKDKLEVQKSLAGEHNAGKILLLYSDSGVDAPEVTIVGGDNNDEKYQFLSTEATDKIMIGHRVTSPALFGVKTAGQLGTTEELKTASMIFERDVIEPYRRVVIQALNKVLDQTGIMDNLTIPSKIIFNADFTDSDAERWLEYLEDKGEVVSDEWEIVSVSDISDPSEEHKIHLEKVEFFKRFANEGAKSENDTGLFKIRYRYSRNLSDQSRTFCKNMVATANTGVVYRFEDINKMSDEGINGEFAAKGESTYSIFLYKGGVNCHHKWERVIYKRKRKAGKFLPNDGVNNDEVVPTSQAEKEGVPFKDKDFKTASTRPIDMPNKGAK